MAELASAFLTTSPILFLTGTRRLSCGCVKRVLLGKLMLELLEVCSLETGASNGISAYGEIPHSGATFAIRAF